MIAKDPAHNKSNRVNAGSTESGGPAYVAIGKLRRPHGIKGDILMEVYTDFPERLKAGKRVFLGNEYKSMILGSIRSNKDLLILSFRGVETLEEAELLRNEVVFVPTKNLPPLPDGEYYHHELIGMRVIDTENNFEGVLVDILETGANDVYLVKDKDGKEVLLPAISEVILSINLEHGVISVRQPEYL